MMENRSVLGALRPVRLMRLPLLLVILLLAAAPAEGASDYYDLLGISRDATTREIRQAFKKLALTMHPDKNPVSPIVLTRPSQ